MPIVQPKNRRRSDAATRQARTEGLLRRWGGPLARLVIAVAVLAALGLGLQQGYAWMRQSPALSLRGIQIRGLKRAPEGELLRLSGLSLGKNLLSLDPEAVERGLRAHPWVKRASVRRQFPTTLMVEIEEHTPEAMASLGDLYLVDSEGEPFKRVQVGDPGDLLVISGLEREAYVRAPEREKARLAQALSVAKAYGATGMAKAAPLSEVRLEADGVVLVLSGTGQEVRLGEGEVEEKLRRLEKTQAELEKRGLRAEVIHLDNRLRPGWVSAKVWTAVSEKKSGPSK